MLKQIQLICTPGDDSRSLEAVHTVVGVAELLRPLTVRYFFTLILVFASTHCGNKTQPERREDGGCGLCQQHIVGKSR